MCYEKMNEINDMCIEKFKTGDEPIESRAKNWPYNPEMTYKEHRMENENPGEIPPQVLKMKIGSMLMLLRNWKLSEGTLFNCEVWSFYLRIS